MNEAPVVPRPDDALLTQFIENQTLELEQRAQELVIEQQREANSFEYGRMALDAQERDRKHARDCRRSERRDQYLLVVVVLLILAALIGGAMLLGHQSIALEMVKAVILLSAGAAGGYGLASRKGRNPQDRE